MRENTPPHKPDLTTSDSELEEVDLADLGADMPEDDDSGDEFQYVGDVGDMSSEEELEMEQPEKDDSILTYSGHKDPVFSCDLHPTLPVAVTGGQDDVAFVWHTDGGQLLHTISQHNDTVTAAKFNHDGTYLATGDMAGTLFVHKVHERKESEMGPIVKLTKAWEYDMGDMSWLRWHRAANVLICGSDSGEVYIFRIPKGDCKVLPGTGERCEAGQLSADGKRLFVGYANGVLKLWDLKECAVLLTVDEQQPETHTDKVLAVDCDPDASLYMSGGIDGKVIFLSNSGPVGACDAMGPVERVAFSPCSDLKLAATGTLNGEVDVWDLNKFSLRIKCEHTDKEDGIASLLWINKHTFVVGTVLGNIYGYDARSGERKFQLYGHNMVIYEMKYNEKTSLLLTVSENNKAKVFKIEDWMCS